MRIDGFAGLCPAKECVALTGLSINNTDSRGVAPCYNISPLQGFNYQKLRAPLQNSAEGMFSGNSGVRYAIMTFMTLGGLSQNTTTHKQKPKEKTIMGKSLRYFGVTVLAILGIIYIAAPYLVKTDWGKSEMLFLAAYDGDTAELRSLIDEGADIDAKNDDGLTPLHVAAGQGQTEIVLALVNAGAAIEAKMNGGSTPLHVAVIHFETETALALVKAGADIDAKDEYGETALHSAARESQAETALALIKAGADIEAKDNEGVTPLHVAAATGQTKNALALIKAGAAIEAKDNRGVTPLHVAVVTG
ncbi:MAG: ankyrin repeat domain-containing protein [Gammaproteobacteria bacterium]